MTKQTFLLSIFSLIAINAAGLAAQRTKTIEKENKNKSKNIYQENKNHLDNEEEKQIEIENTLEKYFNYFLVNVNSVNSYLPTIDLFTNENKNYKCLIKKKSSNLEDKECEIYKLNSNSDASNNNDRFIDTFKLGNNLNVELRPTKNDFSKNKKYILKINKGIELNSETNSKEITIITNTSNSEKYVDLNIEKELKTPKNIISSNYAIAKITKIEEKNESIKSSNWSHLDPKDSEYDSIEIFKSTEEITDQTILNSLFNKNFIFARTEQLKENQYVLVKSGENDFNTQDDWKNNSLIISEIPISEIKNPDQKPIKQKWLTLEFKKMVFVDEKNEYVKNIAYEAIENPHSLIVSLKEKNENFSNELVNSNNKNYKCFFNVDDAKENLEDDCKIYQINNLSKNPIVNSKNELTTKNQLQVEKHYKLEIKNTKMFKAFIYAKKNKELKIKSNTNNNLIASFNLVGFLNNQKNNFFTNRFIAKAENDLKETNYDNFKCFLVNDSEDNNPFDCDIYESQKSTNDLLHINSKQFNKKISVQNISKNKQYLIDFKDKPTWSSKIKHNKIKIKNSKNKTIINFDLTFGLIKNQTEELLIQR